MPGTYDLGAAADGIESFTIALEKAVKRFDGGRAHFFSMLQDTGGLGLAVVFEVEADVADIFWNADAFSFYGFFEIGQTADDGVGSMLTYPFSDFAHVFSTFDAKGGNEVFRCFVARLIERMSGVPAVSPAIGKASGDDHADASIAELEKSFPAEVGGGVLILGYVWDVWVDVWVLDGDDQNSSHLSLRGVSVFA